MKHSWTELVKGIALAAAIGPALVLAAFGQQPPPAIGIPPRPGVPLQPQPAPDLPKFDLDFPGGTPGELVQAISKASGKHLNAIIADEHAHTHIPALRMKDVDVRQLFEALGQASQEQQVNRQQSYPPTQQTLGYYGFRSNDQRGGDHSSVWYFYFYKTPQEAKVCRFYQLAPYLEQYKVEDITTAVQTAWKLLGETSTPVINYHKDTKVLIAVGEATKLQLIDMVLQELGKTMNPPSTPTRTIPSKRIGPADPAK